MQGEWNVVSLHIKSTDVMMLRKFHMLLFSVVFSVVGRAQSGVVEWHDEREDTVRISTMLSEAAQRRFANPSERTGFLARQFVGKPYVAHTLEGDREVVRVNLDEFDCTTLADVSLALSYTLGERRTGWQDFLYNLQRMRYRGGEVDGYPSRLHYNCDWAVDNIHRGNIEDLTRDLPKCVYMVRTIDFMTSHRDKYAALSDSVNFARMKQVEGGFHNHRFPYIKTIDAGVKEVLARLREGDVVAFVSNLKDLDVTHMGILVREADGKLHVLHASSSEGKVVVSRQPFPDFLKRNRQWAGFRVYRLKD